MQSITMDFAIKDTILFSREIKQLVPDKQKTLVRFLANAENHDAYDSYKKLLELLKKNKENSLYQMFLDAREKRKKEIDH